MDRRRVATTLLLGAVVTAVFLAISGYRFYRIVPALRAPGWERFWQYSILLPITLAVIGWLLLRAAAKRPPK